MSGVAGVVDHLFRREAGKMVATLVRVLGVRRVELAEDAVQEALCRALETWKYGHLPENPSAWLFQAARRRAIDLLRRERAPVRAAAARRLEAPPVDEDIRDDQLRMMVACCAPGLPEEAQVAVILKFLCGFGVEEIAAAFLASPAAVRKRLARAKAALKREGPLFERRGAPAAKRLVAVLRALYLLFSEGYHGSHPAAAVREELCAEAMRLAALLAGHPSTATPATFALLGLMCFHAARLPTRIDREGCLILLEAQDRSRWSHALIGQGLLFLERARGESITPYHLEAGIAAIHCKAPAFEATDWGAILKLYDLLYRIRPTPIVALNRAIAVGLLEGPNRGLAELDRLPRPNRLKDYPFLPAARGELLRRAGREDEARAEFRRALKLARNASEARILESKLGGPGRPQ